MKPLKKKKKAKKKAKKMNEKEEELLKVVGIKSPPQKKKIIIITIIRCGKFKWTSCENLRLGFYRNDVWGNVGVGYSLRGKRGLPPSPPPSPPPIISFIR